MSKFKKRFKAFVGELKTGSVRAVFFLAILCALPMFIVSLVMGIFFGTSMDPYNIANWIPFIPSALCMAYIGIISLIGLGKWFVSLFKKKTK